MNKVLLLFKGKSGKGSGETAAEVMDTAERFYEDFYGNERNIASHKNPNIEKTKRSIFSRKYVQESICHQ